MKKGMQQQGMQPMMIGIVHSRQQIHTLVLVWHFTLVCPLTLQWGHLTVIGEVCPTHWL
jgi:hypothetical protein